MTGRHGQAAEGERCGRAVLRREPGKRGATRSSGMIRTGGAWEHPELPGRFAVEIHAFGPDGQPLPSVKLCQPTERGPMAAGRYATVQLAHRRRGHRFHGTIQIRVTAGGVGPGRTGYAISPESLCVLEGLGYRSRDQQRHGCWVVRGPWRIGGTTASLPAGTRGVRGGCMPARALVVGLCRERLQGGAVEGVTA